MPDPTPQFLGVTPLTNDFEDRVPPCTRSLAAATTKGLLARAFSG